MEAFACGSTFGAATGANPMTRQFETLLKVTPLNDGDCWVLLEPLVYRPNGHVITVPAGFVTDFTSTPWFLWWVLPKWGRYGLAAVVHDYLYWTQTGTRAEADAVFRDAMSILGVLWGVRWSMWAALRLFGWVAWWENRKDRQHGVRRVMDHTPEVLQRVPPRGLERLFRRAVGMKAA